jgi:hypothetical protein
MSEPLSDEGNKVSATRNASRLSWSFVLAKVSKDVISGGLRRIDRASPAL